MDNTTEGDSKFKPDVAKRVYKHYKPIALLYRKVALGLGFLVLVFAYCLVMALKGNQTLRLQLEDSKIVRILPDGRATTD